MWAAFAATFLFSFSTVCAQRAARLVGGVEANFWRLTVAALLLGAWSYAHGRGLAGAGFPTLLLSGVIGIGLGDVAWFQALPRLGSRISVLVVQCLMAPMAALVEWLWLGTALKTSQLLWGALIVSGVAVALRPGTHFDWRRRASAVGVCLCGVAALGTASGAVLSRRAYQLALEAGETLDGGHAAFVRIMGGLGVAAAFVLIAKRKVWKAQHAAPPGAGLEISKRKWRGAGAWVVLNAIAGQALGLSFMQWALETTPTGIVMAVLALNPLTVIPLTMAFEGERPTGASLAGSALAVIGIIGLTLTTRGAG